MLLDTHFYSPFPNLRSISTIGQLGKFRANTNTVTHISSSDIAEAGWGDETKKSRDLMLMVMRVTLKPGHNKITVDGEVGKFVIWPLDPLPPLLFTCCSSKSALIWLFDLLALLIQLIVWSHAVHTRLFILLISSWSPDSIDSVIPC